MKEFDINDYGEYSLRADIRKAITDLSPSICGEFVVGDVERVKRLEEWLGELGYK